MNIIEYADREMLVMNVANKLAGKLKSALSGNDRATLAVPGGSTPGPIFEMLSATDLDWARVDVMLTDERWVGEDDERSNARLVKEHLLTGHAAAARFIPFYRDALTPAEGAEQVAPSLAAYMPLSVALMGMGDDMHTASLFPGDPGLPAALANDAPLLCPVYPESQSTPRVTLPAHVLNGALNKHLVIFGSEKLAALKRAEKLSVKEAPISALLDDLEVYWAE
ncbi:6-phosphogluconolactonase [Sulfitobacter delicatus]|uniref:6-phosphogluconolactonase n=1 Tax=Sulfitobacter delicatus TaxID=218672 RepID=A0A1G7RYR3_9RHOB|nr:6-phosphogluconolactonase [Sulfitobacter delicatus]SDG15902.1 6-phosphogluconolactonase [Sulfitobacter delicatus]